MPEHHEREVIAPWFRLGYVIPHLYTDMDAYQLYRIAPEGVMLITTQMDLAEYSHEAAERELPSFWRGVEVLASRNVDVISLSGVPIASVFGRRRTLELLEEVTERTGIRASTDLEAHIAAFESLGARRVAVATRWPEDLTRALVAYLAEAGIDVVATKAIGRDLSQNKQADPMADHRLAIDLGREVLREAPDAEALILPGGLWFAIHAVPILEAETGIPVTLNITATLWDALRAVDAPPRLPGDRWGRLLGSL